MREADIRPMRNQMEEATAEADMAQEEEYESLSPSGEFSKSAMNGMIKEYNKVMPVFGLDKYENVAEDMQVFPADLTRGFAMISSATQDALEADAIDSELLITLDGVSDDRDLLVLSGKLGLLAKSKDFKRYLRESPAEEEEEVSVEDTMQEPVADLDALFASRM